MALAKEAKLELISQYKTHDGDTGSPEVQVALLTKRINELQDHFKTHTKDKSFAPRTVEAGQPAPQPSRLSKVATSIVITI